MSTAVVLAGTTEAEEILTSKNIDYEFRSVPLHEIDLDRSLQGNTRGDERGLVEEWVESYTLVYKSGQEMPPLILMRTSEKPTSKKIVLSGIHRTAAAIKAGLTHLDAFETGPLSDLLMLEVIAEANESVGYGLTTEQRIQTALRFVAQGASIAHAAQRLNVDARKVRDRAASRRADERLRKLNVRRWSELHQQARVALDRVQSDELAKKAGELAVSAQMNAQEVTALVRDVNKATTDTERDEVIGTMWDVYRHRVASGDKRAPKTKEQDGFIGLLRGSISRLANPDAFDLIDDVLATSKPGFDEAVLAAQKFLDEAGKRTRARARAKKNGSRGK